MDSDNASTSEKSATTPVFQRVWNAYTRLTLAEAINLHGWEIGDHTYGTPNVAEREYGHLRIGKYCSIAEQVNIILANHITKANTTYPFAALRALWPTISSSLIDHEAGSVDIGNDVWIGSNVTILAGTSIGDGCIIGASAVVSGYIPPYSVVVGNPAKILKRRFANDVIRRFLYVSWWDFPDEVVESLIPKLLNENYEEFLNIAEEIRSVRGRPNEKLKSSFLLCTERWGDFNIRNDDPEVIELESVIWNPGNPGGIFDFVGNVIPGSLDYYGPDRSIGSQVLEINTENRDNYNYAPEFDYVYGGRINPHYGHFLVNTLPRLWYIYKNGLSNKKIVCHSSESPEDWLKIPFISQIFTYLGLSQDNFIHFDEPKILHKLIVPLPSFEEQNYVHMTFRHLCQEIGKVAVAGLHMPRNAQPVYLSKTRLKEGVGRIINELEIENMLRRYGFEIIYPEELTFADQVILFSTRDFICGSIGSAFHTSIFAQNTTNMLIINTIKDINTNFLLLDQTTKHNVKYYFPIDTKVLPHSESNFLTDFKVVNPQRVGSEIIKIKESLQSYDRLS